MSLMEITLIVGGLLAGAFIGRFFALIKYQRSSVKTQILLKKEKEEKDRWEKEARDLQARHIHSEKQL